MEGYPHKGYLVKGRVHDKVDGVDVGKQLMISRLLKGAFQAGPRLPRYTATWNVQVVLQYLESRRSF